MKQHEMEMVIERIVHYDDVKMFGIYGCDTVEYNRELTRNKYGNISIQGGTRPLSKDGKYNIKFEGEFHHATYGAFYKILEVEVDKLDTNDAQDKFLREVISEKQFDTIKKAYPNEKLVDFILADKINVKLTKGIKEPTLKKIKESIQANMKLANLIAKLSELDISTSKLHKIMEHFKSPDIALTAIETNIYQLCDIKMFGFKTVDEIALRRGDNPESNKRIEACIQYQLKQDTNEGHTWSIKSHLLTECSDLLNLPLGIVETALTNMHKSIIFQNETQVALSFIRKLEYEVFSHLKRISENYTPPKLENIEYKLKETEEYQGFEFTDEQRKAIIDGSQDGVMILNGLAGSGKCILGDSLVFTDRGLIKIEDIPKYYKVDSDGKSKAKIVSYHTDGTREVRSTSHFYNMGFSPTIKIRTTQGYELEGTPEHPVLTIDNNGDLAFKKLKEFCGNEILPISINNNLFGKESRVNEDMAYWMGLLVGDGSTNNINNKLKAHRFTLTNGVKEIGDEFIRISSEQFEVISKKYADGNTFNYSFNKKDVVLDLINELDFPACVAKYKHIPKPIMSAPKKVVRSFLQGLFDTDGCFSGLGFEYSTASKQLATEVHTMLLNFGVVSKLREKVVKGYESNEYFIISISSAQFLKQFQKEINFRLEPNKKRKLEEFIGENKLVNSNTNVLINLNSKIKDVHEYLCKEELTYNKKTGYKIEYKGVRFSIKHFNDKRLGKNGFRKSVSSVNMNKVINKHKEIPHYKYFKNLTENTYIDYVSSIEHSEAIVYDFTVPETHSFVANGIINHNTATVKGLIDSLDTDNYMSAALSGKAVAVLSSRNIHAKTIHRMLGFQDGKFQANEETPLEYDVIVLDEVSMINVQLVHSVLCAVPSGAKLIIVGDSGQLPAIGFGDVLRDLLATQKFPKYELTKVHRQAAKSGILSLANSIRGGNQVFPYDSAGQETFGELQDQTVIAYHNKDSIVGDLLNIAKAYKSKIQKPEDLYDFQVLVANRERGNLSVKNLNVELQSIFNDMSKPSLNRNGYEYREHDKIITQGNAYKKLKFNTVDDYFTKTGQADLMDEEEAKYFLKPYQFDLFNGTLGYIDTIDKHNKLVFIRLDGYNGVVALNETELDKIEMAYAITVHKSQGSGVRNVIFALDYGAFKLLSKQLVYTALTRASEKGVALVEANALHAAIKNDASGIRRTFLADIINSQT